MIPYRSTLKSKLPDAAEQCTRAGQNGLSVVIFVLSFSSLPAYTHIVSTIKSSGVNKKCRSMTDSTTQSTHLVVIGTPGGCGALQRHGTLRHGAVSGFGGALLAALLSVR